MTNTNKAMMIKIRESAYGDLKAYAGEWLTVDTSYLFNDQYNTVNGLRVMDRDVTEVKNDVRMGVITCKYCGKQFEDLQGWEQHLREQAEASGNNCESCYWFKRDLLTIKHPDGTKSEAVDENGQQIMIEESITQYIYSAKRCTNNGGCTCDQCAKYGYGRMTAENCYFLKYPRGYAAWFAEQDKQTQWRELGYTWTGSSAHKNWNVGTYEVVINYNGEDLSTIEFMNTRNHYTLNHDDIERIRNGNSWRVDRDLFYSDETIAGSWQLKPRQSGIDNAGKTVKALFVDYLSDLKDTCKKPAYQSVIGL